MATRHELAEACAKAAVDIAPLGLSGTVIFVLWVVLWDRYGLPAVSSIVIMTTVMIVSVLMGVTYRLFINPHAARIRVVVFGCGFQVLAASLLTLVEALR